MANASPSIPVLRAAHLDKQSACGAQVLLDELLTPGDLASDALADAALQCLFAAAASPGAAAGAAVLLRRAAPSRRSLQALDAHLAASGGGALGAANAAALRAFVGNLNAGSALRDARARCLLDSTRRWHPLALGHLNPLCTMLTSTALSLTFIARLEAWNGRLCCDSRNRFAMLRFVLHTVGREVGLCPNSSAMQLGTVLLPKG
jgi:hypothetical protein